MEVTPGAEDTARMGGLDEGTALHAAYANVEKNIYIIIIIRCTVGFGIYIDMSSARKFFLFSTFLFFLLFMNCGR